MMWDGISSDHSAPMFGGGAPGAAMIGGSIWHDSSANFNKSMAPSAADQLSWGQQAQLGNLSKPPQNWGAIPNSSGHPTFQNGPNSSQQAAKSLWDSGAAAGGPGSWMAGGQGGAPSGPQWGHSAPQPTPNQPTGNWGSHGNGSGHGQSGGWGGPPGTSPGSGARSWADAARPTQPQQAPPTAGGPGPAGRPIVSSTVNRGGPQCDNGTSGWGKPVDQGTPWDAAAGAAKKPDAGSWTSGGSEGGWNSGAAGGGSGAIAKSRGGDMQWAQPPPVDNPNLMWQPPKQPEAPNPSQWCGGGGGAAPSNTGGWDSGSSMVRCNGPLPPDQLQGNKPQDHSMSQHHNHVLNPQQQLFMQQPQPSPTQPMLINSATMNSASMQMQTGHNQASNVMWDAQSTGPAPSNVWQNPNTSVPKQVPPPPFQQQQDKNAVWQDPNVWQDPSPQAKRAAIPDKGTGIWGDPTAQGNDIKRWKTNPDDNTPSPIPSLSTQNTSAIAPGSAQAQQGQGSSGPWNSTTAGTGATTVSKVPTPTGGATSNWNQSASSAGSSWNNTPVAPPKNAGSGWPDSSGWNSKPGSVSSPTKMLSNGWDSNTGAIGQPTPYGQSGDMQNGSDDVFGSTPTSPLTPFASQQRPNTTMANGPTNAGPYNIAPRAVENVANLRKGSLKDGAAGGQQLQIADQLRFAVRCGLIDVKLLQRALPHQTLLLLNQLLHRGTRLELAEKELQQLSSCQSPNPKQQQEYARVDSEIKQLKLEISSLQAQIKAQTEDSSNGQQPMNGATMPMNVPQNESRLNKWAGISSNGSGSTENNEKKSELNTSTSAPNLESLESQFAAGLQLRDAVVGGGGSDTWGQTPKTGSGAEWPTTNAASAANEDGSTAAAKQNESPSKAASDLGGQQQRFMIMMRLLGTGNETGNDGTTPENAVDKGPPEFKPGQPWNWNDPSKDVDENTTPLDWQEMRSTLSVAAPGVDPERRLKDEIANKSKPNYMSSASAYNSTQNQGPVVGDFWTGSSNAFSKQPPISMTPSGMSRPPSQMGNMMMQGGRPPVRPSWNSTPNQSAFAPYLPPQSPWILLTHIGPQMNGELLKQIIFNKGNVENFTFPPGANFAVVRFKDHPVERIVPSLQNELAHYGITVNLARDQQVESLLMGMANSSPMLGPPPPPPQMPYWDAGFGTQFPPPMAMPPYDGIGMQDPMMEHHIF